jgi:uncharacterized damage-inducible protein DinB
MRFSEARRAGDGTGRIWRAITKQDSVLSLMTTRLATTCNVTPERDIALEAEEPAGKREEAASRMRETEDTRRIVAAAVAILAQGEDLLESVSPEEFARRNPQMFNGSIGGHYRHCLDHFSSWLRGLEAGEVNYDHRERDPRIEREPAFALQATRDIREALQRVQAGELGRPVMACCEVSYEEGESPRTASSYSREMVYVVAHAIHHYALISVMARLMDITLPPHFGVAPSTVAHQAGINGG